MIPEKENYFWSNIAAIGQLLNYIVIGHLLNHISILIPLDWLIDFYSS